ncbi:M20 family metallo-hydrolase [Sporosarcina sp. CAU 1771]
MNNLKLIPNIERIQKDIESISRFVDESKPGWTRKPFTPWYTQSRDWLTKQMTDCGLEVEVDAASNLVGVRPGKNPELKPILIGSHTDTVVGGGRFDGVAGVVAGLEIVRMLNEANIELNHPLRIIDFTAEEASDFGISTIGSRGLVNNLPAEVLTRADATGLILNDALVNLGGRPANREKHALKKGDIALYLELHIEQGPVLDKTGDKLGVVSGIVGIQRFNVVVEGVPNHGGTTPSNMRNDALMGASEILLVLEALCQSEESIVGTVGRLHVHPNSISVIPGQVEFGFEVRSMDVAMIEHVVNQFQERARGIAQSRGLTVDFDLLSTTEPIGIPTHVQEVLYESCQTVASTRVLTSGAGHDANQLATVGPIGMIFVPSKGGVSHSPEEWTDYEDIAKGIEALARALVVFDRKLSDESGGN